MRLWHLAGGSLVLAASLAAASPGIVGEAISKIKGEGLVNRGFDGEYSKKEKSYSWEVELDRKKMYANTAKHFFDNEMVIHKEGDVDYFVPKPTNQLTQFAYLLQSFAGVASHAAELKAGDWATCGRGQDCGIISELNLKLKVFAKLQLAAKPSLLPVVKQLGIVTILEGHEMILVSLKGVTTVRHGIWTLHSFAKSNLRDDPHYLDIFGAKIHPGFRIACEEIYQQAADALGEALKKYPHFTPVISGYSMGGAVAQLLAARLMEDDDIPIELIRARRNLKLVTFAQPKVGNEQFANGILQKIKHVIRFTCQEDYIPHLAPRYMGYRQTPVEVWWRYPEKGKLDDPKGDKATFRLKYCFGIDNENCNLGVSTSIPRTLATQSHGQYVGIRDSIDDKWYVEGETESHLILNAIKEWLLKKTFWGARGMKALQAVLRWMYNRGLLDSDGIEV